MTVIGTLGSPWRAEVNDWGALAPDDGSATVDWWVAADDRWHLPASEASRRQRRMLGAPVIETVVGVPGGDVVHRAYAVADGGGAPVIELENRSPLPVAVAFSRADVVTGRPLGPLPPDAPVGALVVVPLGHRSTVRVGIAAALNANVAPAEQVARGWVAQTSAGARFEVPDEPLTERIVAARADVLLATPDPADPVPYVLAVAERCRLGAVAEPWVTGVADAAIAVAKGARRGASWDDSAALDAVAEVLLRAGEDGAAGDVARIAGRLPPAPPDPPDPPDGVRVLAWLERRLLRRSAAGLDLLPGFPPAWMGQGVEVHGATSGRTVVGYAVRWHGERPALLWELSEPVPLTCSGLDATWSTTAARGDALLAPFRR